MSENREICDTKSCDLTATERVYWPGKSPPPVMCLPCAGRAINIARAMGFPLHVEPLPAPPEATP